MKFLLIGAVASLCVLALLLAALIMWPVAGPARMATVTGPFAAVDFSDLEEPRRLEARDGAAIAYRVYPAGDASAVALLLHGSSADGRSLHPLAKALAGGGVSAYALDIRGHGASGRRGDVDHIGQPAEDVADMLAYIATQHPGLPVTLLGFSSGGGLALNAAGQDHADGIAKLILVSPMLGVDQPSSTEPNPNAGAGRWARPDIPRIIGLSILNGFGVHALDGLPVITFATGGDPQLVAHYSHRLLLSMNPQDAPALLRAVTAPVTLLAGEKDEVFTARAYADTMHAARPQAEVTLLPGLGHIDMTLEPAAFAAILAAIPRRQDGR